MMVSPYRDHWYKFPGVFALFFAYEQRMWCLRTELDRCPGADRSGAEIAEKWRGRPSPGAGEVDFLAHLFE